MTAQNQAWVWDVIYSPFGETSYIWTNPGTIDIRFPGQWFQLESGLAYNWHRHYDATLGRYLQPDPIGLKGGRSLYGYAKQNSLTYVDSDGQNAVLAGAAICAENPICAAAVIGAGIWIAEHSIPAIVNACKRKDRKDDCTDMFEDDTRWCDNRFRGRKNIACHAWANEELERCLKGTPRQPFRYPFH
jgi:RHS repeat-associated protein